MKATIREVARSAGVSETTVSLSFQPNSRISEATKKKVMRVAGELKYMPNQAARNLRQGGSKMLAILVNDITNPFYARMVRTVEATARARGYNVIVMESQWVSACEVDAVNRMLEARVQGVIICQCEDSDEGLKLLKRYEVPYIALDSFPIDYDGPYVANDMIAAGKLAAEHLIEVGCKNPALVIPKRGRRRFSSFIRLRQGFAAVMKSGKIPFGQSQIFNAGLTIGEGQEVFLQILDKMPEVDGILCGNDLCALGVMEAIEKYGYKIAVIGIDDLPVSSLAKISLTSIQQPCTAVSEQATEAIIDGIEKKESISLQKALTPILIKRNSTLLTGIVKNSMRKH